MRNVWKKIKEKWLDYWQDDMLDRTKTHLSQYDKRSLLYGGFMVGIATVLLCSLGIFIGNSWADKRNDKAMEEILWTLAAYMALAAVVVSRGSPEVPGGTIRDCKRSPRPRASPGFGSSPVQK